MDPSYEPVVPPGDGGLVRVRLELAYDGTAYYGWATQPGLPTVQGTLEAALTTVLRGKTPRLTVAGRTDTGVHALHQVAHVDVPADVPLERLARQLDALVPSDIRVHSARVAPDGFDARFSALSREYAYRVSAPPGRVNPLRRHDTLEWKRPLDLDAMRTAAASLLGEHDFASFCRRREGATTIRELAVLDWSVLDDGVLVARVMADAFCRSMVRSLVGALLAVGDGRRPVGVPASLLQRGQRAHEVTVAPAHGLTLVRVSYPPDDEVGLRASQTRVVRTR
jgi:tRNA pseudouridine38-40 synthase